MVCPEEEEWMEFTERMEVMESTESMDLIAPVPILLIDLSNNIVFSVFDKVFIPSYIIHNFSQTIKTMLCKIPSVKLVEYVERS